MRTKKKKTTALSVAAVLFCLVLVTAHFTSGMYARYTTRANDNDRGHMAAFAVKAEPVQVEPVSITAGGEATYQIKVTNSGEVAVHYVATVNINDEADDVSVKSGEVLEGYLAPGKNEIRNVVFVLTGTPRGDGSAPFTVTVDFTQIN